MPQKLNKINWWSNDSVTEDPNVQPTFQDYGEPEIPEPIIVPQQPVVEQPTAPTQAAPYIQPIVIVPFSSGAQPIYHYDPTRRKQIPDTYDDEVRDFVKDDDDAYVLGTTNGKVGKRLPEAEIDRLLAKDNAKRAKANQRAAKRPLLVRKRPGAFIVILLLSLILLAAIAVPAVVNIIASDADISFLGYLNLYEAEEADKSISTLDPSLALVDFAIMKIQKNEEGMEMLQNNFTEFMKATEGKDALAQVSTYVAACAPILMVIALLIMFIKSIVALASKKRMIMRGEVETSGYRKYSFGFLSILLLLLGVASIICGMYTLGLDITAFLDFVLLKSTPYHIGYVGYALIGIPIIMFICACCTYKKQK